MLRILQWLPSLLSLLQGLQGGPGPGPNFWLYFMPLSFSVAKLQTHRVSSYSLQHQVTSHCTAVRKPFPLLECLLSPTGTPSTCLLLRIQAQPNHHFLREASLTYTGALFTTCTAAHLIRAPAIPQSWIAATASEKRIPPAVWRPTVCPPHSQMVFLRQDLMSAMAPNPQMAPLHTLNKTYIPPIRPFKGWPPPTCLPPSCQTSF